MAARKRKTCHKANGQFKKCSTKKPAKKRAKKSAKRGLSQRYDSIVRREAGLKKRRSPKRKAASVRKPKKTARKKAASARKPARRKAASSRRAPSRKAPKKRAKRTLEKAITSRRVATVRKPRAKRYPRGGSPFSMAPTVRMHRPESARTIRMAMADDEMPTRRYGGDTPTLRGGFGLPSRTLVTGHGAAGRRGKKKHARATDWW